MKPFFRDNMCMEDTKQELFFETRFLVSFVKNQLLTFTVPTYSCPTYSINKFNHFLSHSISCSASFNSNLSHFQIKHNSTFYPAIYSHGG